MVIIIDNKQVALPEDFEFEYISENRLFTEADDYSLSITLPLAGCPTNTNIFGHVNRADVHTSKLIFDCEIIAGNFRKSGAAAITDITEADVTVQFLAGRSAQNYVDPLESIFINELELDMNADAVAKCTSEVEDAWNPYVSGCKYVALPWVSNSSGNIQNCFIIKSGRRVWHENTKALSRQPYLLEITRAILNNIEYSYDLEDWREHRYLRWLLVCNSLPAAWGIKNFAKALPHWSVKEFFSKLELLLGAEFEFDHNKKSVCFSFLHKQALNAGPTVNIENVVYEHSAGVDVSDPDCQYRGMKNIVFADRGDNVWKYESCNRIDSLERLGKVSFNSLNELMLTAKELRVWSGYKRRDEVRQKLLYAQDVNAYFVLRAVDKQWLSPHKPTEEEMKAQILPCKYTLALQPLNQLGGRVTDLSDNAAEEQIDFIPVYKDNTDENFGRMMFLSPATFDEETESENDMIFWGNMDPDQYCLNANNQFRQTTVADAIEQGEPDKNTEYFNNIFVGFWTGEKRSGCINPVPSTAIFEPDDNFGITRYNFSLNPASESSASGGIFVDIDKRLKFSFQFISDIIPDVRAVFLIRGIRYLCEKITVKFSNNGMSKLIKGDFYRINV